MKRFIEQFCILLLLACFTSASAQNEDRGCNLTVVVDSTHASAPQAQDGSVNAIATGGAEPYTYRWYTGETSQSRSNLGTGYYCVTVTDANGCTGSDCSRVSAPGCESFNWGISFTANSALNTIDEVSASASDGTEPYSYVWSNGATTPSIQNVPNNVYCVTITDALNCSATPCAGIIVTNLEEVPALNANIYPNPVNGVMHIDAPNIIDGVISIYSLDGKLVLAESLVQGSNSIATHGIAKGLYICRISNGSTYTNRKILIE